MATTRRDRVFLKSADPTYTKIRHAEKNPEDLGIDKPGYVHRVYFLLDHETCEVKIGFSDNYLRRQRELEARRGHKLELLGTLNGGRRLERAMHSRFADHRTSREWYTTEIAADVLSLVAADQEWYEGIAA